MMMPALARTAILATFCLALPAAAEEPLVSVDLLDGWQTPEGTTMAGLRIRLADGWKTYWRAPGDAGIPPQFRWSGSENLEGVRVHWPVPMVFEQGGMRSIGYRGEVVLPIELIPATAGAPVTLSGEAELGVCRDICMPVRVSFLEPAGDGATAIRAAMADRPDARAITRARCDVDPIDDGLKVTATLDLRDLGGNEVTVFELMNTADVWVSETVSDRQGARLTAHADLVPPQAAPFALDRSQLRITVLGRNGAAETLGCTGS